MLPLRFVALVILLMLSAFFSSSETALFSLRPLQTQALQRERSRRARAILALLQHPRRLLSTILVGNTLVNIVLSILAAGVFVEVWGPEKGPMLATVIMTLVLLVLGEITPKTLAVARSSQVARLVSPALQLVDRLLLPLTDGIVRLTDAIHQALERRIPKRDEALSESEIKTLVTMGWEHGIVGGQEKEFIHNVFHLNDHLVKDIVTPRVQVFAIPADSTVEAVRESISDRKFTRIPVYEGDIENIIGYIELRDLLWAGDEPDPRRVADLVRELPFYPENKRVGELLSEMHRHSQRIAGVIDEHGGFEGVVSLEDAVEQVVGEIFDSHDLDRFRFNSLPNGEVLVTAQMALDVFNDLMDTRIEDSEVETIGGHVLRILGRVPASGEVIQQGDLRIQVEKATAQRILMLRVARSGSGRKT